MGACATATTRFGFDSIDVEICCSAFLHHRHRR
jgi:hypothetical protein